MKRIAILMIPTLLAFPVEAADTKPGKKSIKLPSNIEQIRALDLAKVRFMAAVGACPRPEDCDPTSPAKNPELVDLLENASREDFSWWPASSAQRTRPARRKAPGSEPVAGGPATTSARPPSPRPLRRPTRSPRRLRPRRSEVSARRATGSRRASGGCAGSGVQALRLDERGLGLAEAPFLRREHAQVPPHGHVPGVELHCSLEGPARIAKPADGLVEHGQVPTAAGVLRASGQGSLVGGDGLLGTLQVHLDVSEVEPARGVAWVEANGGNEPSRASAFRPTAR